MRFQVPQFIETETKLIGPFSLRQFIWLVVGGTAYIFAQLFLTGTPLLVVAIIIAGLVISMMYVKINEVNLPKYILMGFVFSVSQKKYTFKKEDVEGKGNFK